MTQGYNYSTVAFRSESHWVGGIDEETAERIAFHLVEALFLTADSQLCNLNSEFYLITTTCRAPCYRISQHLAADWDAALIQGPASKHFLSFRMHKTLIKQSVCKIKLFQKWGWGSMLLPLFFFLNRMVTWIAIPVWTLGPTCISFWLKSGASLMAKSHG